MSNAKIAPPPPLADPETAQDFGALEAKIKELEARAGRLISQINTLGRVAYEETKATEGEHKVLCRLGKTRTS